MNDPLPSCAKQRDDEDDHGGEREPERDALREYEPAERRGGEEDGADGKGPIKKHVSILQAVWHGARDRHVPCLQKPPDPTTAQPPPYSLARHCE